MKGFLFLQRVAFLLNIIFFVCVIFWAVPKVELPQGLTSFLMIAGWPLSMFINLVIVCWFLILLLLRKQTIQPIWLPVVNSVIFILQLIFFFL
jgi:hypothetical protein